MSGHIHIKTAEDFAAAFPVSRETLARLETYASLLRRWQPAVNLVAPKTLDDIWHRHFADSAQLLGLAPRARVWLDLGSGAGFPGLVIAVLLANQGNVASVHLVESNARKCAFLAEVARATGAPVDIHNARIESLKGDTRVTPDIVTARALAPLDTLLDNAFPFFGPGTRALFLKGRAAEEEVAQARRRWSFEASLMPSRTEGQGRVIAIDRLAPKGGAGEGRSHGR